MLSHDYNHFEASMGLSNENGLTTAEIDNARKDCQRLTIKAVQQYITHKNVETKNRVNQGAYERLLKRVERIRLQPESEWLPSEKATVKALEDWNWDTRRRPYDYEDDFDMDDWQEHDEDDLY